MNSLFTKHLNSSRFKGTPKKFDWLRSLKTPFQRQQMYDLETVFGFANAQAYSTSHHQAGDLFAGDGF